MSRVIGQCVTYLLSHPSARNLVARDLDCPRPGRKRWRYQASNTRLVRYTINHIQGRSTGACFTVFLFSFLSFFLGGGVLLNIPTHLLISVIGVIQDGGSFHIRVPIKLLLVPRDNGRKQPRFMIRFLSTLLLFAPSIFLSLSLSLM